MGEFVRTLTMTDMVTGWTENYSVFARTPRATRYEHANPGDLVHLDVKNTCSIPGGGGWRTLGNARTGNKKKSVPTGYSCLLSAIDDHPRVLYSKILKEEKRETAAAFCGGAHTYYDSLGFSAIGHRPTMVPANNPATSAPPSAISNTHTRRYSPQTNGEIGRFPRTRAVEWACAHHYNSEQARAATHQGRIHDSNHRRPRTGISGTTLIDCIHNVNGKNTQAPCSLDMTSAVPIRGSSARICRSQGCSVRLRIFIVSGSPVGEGCAESSDQQPRQ